MNGLRSADVRLARLPWHPAELLAAKDQPIPDLIAKNLKVLFCGINPGLWSGATGHHFARPGNRFWPVLRGGGFTPTVFKQFEEARLLSFGSGITNFVDRTTAAAAELRNACSMGNGDDVTHIKGPKKTPIYLDVRAEGLNNHDSAGSRKDGSHYTEKTHAG